MRFLFNRNKPKPNQTRIKSISKNEIDRLPETGPGAKGGEAPSLPTGAGAPTGTPNTVIKKLIRTI